VQSGSKRKVDEWLRNQIESRIFQTGQNALVFFKTESQVSLSLVSSTLTRFHLLFSRPTIVRDMNRFPRRRFYCLRHH